MKSSLIWLGLILTVSLGLRLYKIDTPLADWHSWRQADTVSVTREYVKNGIDLLRPRYLDLSNIPSGLENPEGWRMVEFPLINGLTAWLYNLIPNNLELHVFARLVAIDFSLGSIILLYLLVKTLVGEKLALMSSFVFGVLPYNVFYSRTALPEVPLVFFSLGALYFMVRKLSLGKSVNSWEFWLSAVFASIAVLIKPYALLLALPLGYMKFKSHGLKLFRHWASYVYLLIVIGPFLLWRMWIMQFPEGIPAFWWLLNGNGIRFKGAWFRWLFAERLGKLILGYWGLIPFSLGLMAKSKSKFFHYWLLAIGLYLVIFATGNVQHDYYQIFTMPIVSYFVARGLVFLMDNKIFSRISSYLLLATSFFFMLAFSWFEVRGYYNINNPAIVEAGKAVDSLIEEDALVVAPYGGDTALLYQTNRRGWPIGGNIETRIAQGADYYVTVAVDDEALELKRMCNLVFEDDSFTIISLVECASSDDAKI